jgi:HEAT repeat protein
LADPEPAVRAAAADGLARGGRADAAARLVQLLGEDPDRSVRERAALALGLIRVEGSDQALIAACQREAAPEVRAAAVMALGAWDQESVVARLMEMSDEAEVRRILETRLREDAEYRLLAQRMRGSRRAELRAVASTSRAGMEQALAEGTRGALNPAARVRLIAGLRAFQGDRSRGALRQMLHGDPAPEVRVAALSALVEIVDPTELEEVAGRALTDPDRRVRLVAAQLIRRIPAERSLPLLLHALRGEDDPGVLQAAGEAMEADAEGFATAARDAVEHGRDLELIARLARHTRHASVAGLVPTLAAHTLPEVRAAASDLMRSRPELVESDALAGLLADPVAEVRRAAIRAATAARKPEFALPLVRDPDGAVRVTAVVAALLGGADVALPADLARAQLADEARLATDLDALRVLARTHPDASRRAGAAVLLALTDENSAREVAAQDPSEAVRARIRRALGEA